MEDCEVLMDWHPGVHKLDGVSLPRDIEYTLSLNLKYLFPGKEKKDISFQWFDKLARLVRLRIFFAGKEGEEPTIHGLPLDKNPGFDVRIKDAWFQQGLQLGKKRLKESVKGPRLVPRKQQGFDVWKHALVTPSELTEFMEKRDLLAFITDKNLGICVVTRSWYREELDKFKSLPILSNADNSWKQVQMNASTLIRTLVINKGAFLGNVVVKFLNKSETMFPWGKEPPVFHGIPKIHKDPWKIRPIVPMHSYITSRLAMVVQRLLLPVQRQYAWVCESTGSLLKDIDKYNRKLFKPTRLHTGDVTAMYTRIPRASFMPLVMNEVSEYYGSRRKFDTINFLRSALEIVWDYTVFSINGTVMRQTDGVPMGVHCGPVFANLYMAAGEKTWINTFPGLYRRYIDDILVLCTSDEVVESLEWTPGMEVTWNHSGTGLSFLDAWIHNHDGQSEVCYRPFNKPLNHNQYIPWASCHPTHVKKGMVKGELTRAATLSRRIGYFETWKSTFLQRLRLRGWPRKALKAWAKQVQWGVLKTGKGKAIDTKNTLFVKTQYNAIWNRVDPGDIWRCMTQYWDTFGPEGLKLPSVQIQAKKRTTSLWDVVRSSNRKHQPARLTIRERSTVSGQSSLATPERPLL